MIAFAPLAALLAATSAPAALQIGKGSPFLYTFRAGRSVPLDLSGSAAMTVTSSQFSMSGQAQFHVLGKLSCLSVDSKGQSRQEIVLRRIQATAKIPMLGDFLVDTAAPATQADPRVAAAEAECRKALSEKLILVVDNRGLARGAQIVDLKGRVPNPAPHAQNMDSLARLFYVPLPEPPPLPGQSWKADPPEVAAAFADRNFQMTFKGIEAGSALFELALESALSSPTQAPNPALQNIQGQVQGRGRAAYGAADGLPRSAELELTFSGSQNPPAGDQGTGPAFSGSLHFALSKAGAKP